MAGRRFSACCRRSTLARRQVLPHPITGDASTTGSSPPDRRLIRLGWVIASYVPAFCVGASALLHPLPRLIWNASASVPIGLYAVHPVGTLQVTELVVVRPPIPLAWFLDERHYLPIGVPMLKRILAVPGQTVCRTDSAITVDGVVMGRALDRDSLGRHLPAWHGCRHVAEGEVFLMNWELQRFPSMADTLVCSPSLRSSVGRILSGRGRMTNRDPALSLDRAFRVLPEHSPLLLRQICEQQETNAFDASTSFWLRRRPRSRDAA